MKAELPKLFLKAAPGMRVKDPLSLKVLAEVGEFKPDNNYWRRQLHFGDCVEVAPPKSEMKAEIVAPSVELGVDSPKTAARREKNKE